MKIINLLSLEMKKNNNKNNNLKLFYQPKIYHKNN